MFKNNLKTIVVFGGTSDIANACLHQWLNDEDMMVILVGRQFSSLKASADNLSVRFPNSIFDCIEIDFSSIDSIQFTIQNLFKSQLIHIALIAHGNLSEQKRCQMDLEYCQKELNINGLSVCIISEALASGFNNCGSGTLAVIGSVAGDRGRKSNYAYGAAKSLVEKYTEGLQHRFHNSPINVVLIKPGPTESKMTNHLLNTPTRLSKATDVAKIIVKGIQKNRQTIYAPRKWYIIMWVIKFLPKSIFHKLNI